MAPTQASALELHFDGSRFSVDQRYLLTIHGQYQSGTWILGFTINRILSAQDFTAEQLVVIQRDESLKVLDGYLDSLPVSLPISCVCEYACAGYTSY